MLLFQKYFSLKYELSLSEPYPYWFGEQYRKINIEKEDFTVISIKDIHKKNYLCLLQPQRSRRLTATTVGSISPPFTAVNTTIIYIYIYIYIYI